jgi:hypothetical protein
MNTNWTRPQGPFRGLFSQAIKDFAQHWLWYAWGTFLPILGIAWARAASEDYTGAQYSILIGLLTALMSMSLARLAVSGKPKHIGLVSFYNAILSRYLSGVGLLILAAALTLPALALFLAAGVAVTGTLPLWSLIISVPLTLFATALAVGGAFALFALMDDMEISVVQAYRVSYRLSRRYWLPLLRVLAILCVAVIVVFALMGLISQSAAEALQNPQWQIVYDALVSLILTPFIFTLWARVYERMVEAYE